MKNLFQLASAVALLGALTATATAEIIFNQDFDGGYTGTFGTGQYFSSSDPPSAYGNSVITSGGNPNGAWQEYMTTTSWSNYYAGQVQIMQIDVHTDPNPADYTISFDAMGSDARSIQVTMQSWQDRWFGGSQLFSITRDVALSAANTWQTVSFNLADLSPTLDPTGRTWQIAYQLNSWQWGGPGMTDTLTIDNIVLSRIPEPSTISLLAVSALAALWFFRRK
jgi:hypothetical protein